MRRFQETCVHFNGIANDECEAGIDYRWFPVNELPCVKPATKLCDKRRFPTEEEIEAHHEEVEESNRKCVAICNVIKKIKEEHSGKSWQGVETCPICGGNVSVSITSFNGHTHGKCETEGCLGWME